MHGKQVSGIMRNKKRGGKFTINQLEEVKKEVKEVRKGVKLE